MDPGPVEGVDGATTDAITVLLADVKIVLVFKVVVMEPMESVLGSNLVSRVEVTLVPMVACPFVVTIVFLLFPSLIVLFSFPPPEFPPLSPLIPMGCGTLGIPEAGGLEVGGTVGWGGTHHKILQSSQDLTSFPSSLQ